MRSVPALVSPIVFAAVLLAGTPGASGVVKQADLGGYRVIVEGGGVEERKEIQYDANGNVIYDSRGAFFRDLDKGTIDDSLLGDGLELNLDPTANVPETPPRVPESSENPQSDADDASVPAKVSEEEIPEKKSRSPWAASPKAVAAAKKILEERRAAEARIRAETARIDAETARRVPEPLPEGERDAAKLSDDSVFVDPRNALVTQPMTEDGRKMPFYLQRGDGDFGDPAGGLKNFMKINERYSGEIERRGYEIEHNEGYDNIISMKEWHSRYTNIGIKRNERYEGSAEGFSRRATVPELIERRLLENTLVWESTREAQISVNETLARKLIERYTTGTAAGKFDARLPAPGERTGLSMQDLNRYHFRRSHSTEPGLPAVQPAGGLRNLK